MTTPAASVPRLTISPTGDHRTGILFANLGTPDGTDYRSMRRFLAEFLSDRRVVDVPAWKWQPILQTVVLTRRPFASGKVYRSIWNEEADESPMLTITRAQRRPCPHRTAVGRDPGQPAGLAACLRSAGHLTRGRAQPPTSGDR